MKQLGKFWAVVFVAFGCSVVSGCGGGSGTESNGDGDGDSPSTGGAGTGGDAATGGGPGTGGGPATGGSATGGSDGATGGTDGSTGGSPTAPIACSPDISGQMVPCEGTPAEVPTQTKSFSVTGPFAAGETVALSLRASSRSGMIVQAFAEQAACDDSMTMIEEVVVPSADYSCIEVSVTEAAQAVRFEFLDEAVSYPWLYAACGGCP